MTSNKTKSIVLNDMNKSEKQSFSYSIYNKNNFEKFCELETDKMVKSIDRKDLPSEFSEETCEFLNLFRRKTVNETNEWAFHIDYENNEIIHCFRGNPTTVKGNIHIDLMKNRKIVSIHNHPIGTYSAPSAANFEILDHEFQHYEIICSENEFWIIEGNGMFEKQFIRDFKKEINELFEYYDSLRKTDSQRANELYT